MPKRRRPLDQEALDNAVDAFAEGLVEEVRGSATETPSAAEQAQARSQAIAGATLSSQAMVLRRDRAVWASKRFFKRAAEELVESTRSGRELAGACFLRELSAPQATTSSRSSQRDAQRARSPHAGPADVQLVGLKREVSGLPGRVPIEPAWGDVLWHTHPGLKGSLAAFSIEDLQVAKESRKPLLVIGFVGFSLDVLSTLAMPFGLKAAAASAGVKGLLALEKRGTIPTRLLEYGVGARICWPSGVIQPVLRLGAPPWQQALDDMSFTVDRGVGAVERAGQQVFRDVLGLIANRRR